MLRKLASWESQELNFRAHKRILFVCTTAIAVAFLSTVLTGQNLSMAPPPSVEKVLDQSFRAMYNLQFDEALSKLEAAKALSKDDPLPWVAQSSAVLFREFTRLKILRSEMFISDENFDARPAQKWDPAGKKQFDDTLAGAEQIAQERLKRDRNDVRALFALTLVNGLRADDSALITKKNIAAIGYTKAASSFAERLLALAPNQYDAYLATGMGKYIVGGKAAPIRWLLRLDGLKGDQEQGVKEMKLAAEQGHYLAPFARILLAFDDLRHKNKAEALKKLTWLHDQFPNNPLFALEISKLETGSATGGQ
jgi:TPR repeat protein